jgi:hypothetical protein
MNLLARLFADKKTQSPTAPEEASHRAVTQFTKGEISRQEMLARLVAGFISIPLAEPPKMEKGYLKSWKPATVSKANASQWLVAFTYTEAGSTFGLKNDYSFILSTGTKWLLDVLPPGHGLVLNLGSQYLFEWSAEEISKYKIEVLGHSAS